MWIAITIGVVGLLGLFYRELRINWRMDEQHSRIGNDPFSD